MNSPLMRRLNHINAMARIFTFQGLSRLSRPPPRRVPWARRLAPSRRCYATDKPGGTDTEPFVFSDTAEEADELGEESDEPADTPADRVEEEEEEEEPPQSWREPLPEPQDAPAKSASWPSLATSATRAWTPFPERLAIPSSPPSTPPSSSPPAPAQKMMSKKTSPLPPPKPPKERVIFSAIQPTGMPHLGNYLGAIRPWVQLQNESPPGGGGGGGGTKLLFSIADLHALTTRVRDKDEGLMRYSGPHARRQTVAALLAAGLDPDRCIIFCQSGVPQHAELQWILSCQASVGYLSRMTQWKAKLSFDKDATLDQATSKLKHGLFSYPILMAADILVHRATHVPVGEDQRQHLEFTRECVTNFNHAYENVFYPPKTLLSPFRRVMNLRHPEVKMSKSDGDPRGQLRLTDTRDTIMRKINGAVTDTRGVVTRDVCSADAWPPRPGVANMLTLLSHLEPNWRGVLDVGNPGRKSAVKLWLMKVENRMEREAAERGEVPGTDTSTGTGAETGGGGEEETWWGDGGEDDGEVDGKGRRKKKKRTTTTTMMTATEKSKQYLTPEEWAQGLEGHSMRSLKVLVAEAINRELRPFRERYIQLIENKDYLDEVVRNGNEKARASAEETMKIVREVVGMCP